jgi:hypothetical protein
MIALTLNFIVEFDKTLIKIINLHRFLKTSQPDLWDSSFIGVQLLLPLDKHAQ